MFNLTPHRIAFLFSIIYCRKQYINEINPPATVAYPWRGVCRFFLLLIKFSYQFSVRPWTWILRQIIGNFRTGALSILYTAIRRIYRRVSGKWCEESIWNNEDGITGLRKSVKTDVNITITVGNSYYRNINAGVLAGIITVEIVQNANYSCTVR